MTALVPASNTARVAGHFGEFFQGRHGPAGPVALVTVPCPAWAATVQTAPGPFAVDGADASAARRLFDALGHTPGRF